jgi:hypothetical protein
MTERKKEKNLDSGEQASAALSRIWKLHASQFSVSTSSKLPVTSPSRIVLSTTTDEKSSPEKTILYLAYGSNLCAETFKGNRGIKPLSAVNVHVPSLDLTFDLPGIPYQEPCFANTRYRKSPPSRDDYHKDRWHKGLIGVVYEVTPEDYRTIIATEGGGASYQDVIVPCYVIPSGMKGVDPQPSGASFKAHTLFAPSDQNEGGRGISRPDPSYAQASARYLKLITDGAEEHELPAEYLAYLYNIRPYTITTYRQKVGQALFLAVWFPIVIFLFGLAKTAADEEGKIPKWLIQIQGVVFRLLWASYDNVYKKAFGDGERTMNERDEEEAGVETQWREKGIQLDGTT